MIKEEEEGISQVSHQKVTSIPPGDASINQISLKLCWNVRAPSKMKMVRQKARFNSVTRKRVAMSISCTECRWLNYAWQLIYESALSGNG